MHASLFQVGDEGGCALVDKFGGSFGALFNGTVVIPAAVVELDEAYAAFGGSACEQAV